MADQKVGVWDVSQKKIVYSRLAEQFGVSIIDEDLIARLEKVTGIPVHPWIRRRLFWAHRDLDILLNEYEAGRPVYIYTGRGPSSESMHLGHYVPFEMTRWCQEAFKAVVVIQISDDEKFYVKDKSMEEIERMGYENAKDIIAFGFDPEKTFIWSNYKDYHSLMHGNHVQAMSKTNYNQMKGIFGVDGSDNLGKITWGVKQSIPAFSSSFPFLFTEQNPHYKENGKSVACVVVMAIDQDPYFRLARDLAPKMGERKNVSLMSKFLPSLGGDSKANSSDAGTEKAPPIFLTQTQDEITAAVKKHAISGGGDTLWDQQKNGANLDVDVSFQYLTFFEKDDAKLQEIAELYGNRFTLEELAQRRGMGAELEVAIKEYEASVKGGVLDKFKDLGRKAENEMKETLYKYMVLDKFKQLRMTTGQIKRFSFE